MRQIDPLIRLSNRAGPVHLASPSGSWYKKRTIRWGGPMSRELPVLCVSDVEGQEVTAAATDRPQR